jgi:hypothetical protein
MDRFAPGVRTLRSPDYSRNSPGPLAILPENSALPANTAFFPDIFDVGSHNAVFCEVAGISCQQLGSIHYRAG